MQSDHTSQAAHPQGTTNNRRSLLRLGAAGAISALAGAGLAKTTLRAEAAAGDAVVVGAMNEGGNASTALRSSSRNSATLNVYNTSRAYAVNASGEHGGVAGSSEHGVGILGVGQTGVRASAIDPGVGNGGTALRVEGRAAFSTGGTVVIPEGKSSATKDLDHFLAPGSFVVASVQERGRGSVVEARRVGAKRIRVSVSRPAPSGGTTVGFLVLEPA